MSEGPPRSPRWKRRILRILAGLVALPMVLLLVVNLVLLTPWARDWLGRRITARAGLDASVGRASFTPWSGVFLGAVTLQQPLPLRASIGEPFLELQGIRVIPRWQQWIKGKPGIAEVRIEGPRVVVAVEMLTHLASSGVAVPAPASPPTVLALQPPSSPADGGVVSQPPVLPSPGLTVLPSPAPATVPPAGSLDPLPGDWPETVWIVITDARLQLRSAAIPGVLGDFSGLEARIPVAGRAAPSTLTLARVDLLGRNVASGVSLPLAWNPPELRVGPKDLTVAGLQVKFAALAGRLPGTPFAVEVTVPPQSFDASGLFAQLRPTAQNVEARVQGIGLLRVPSSWQGVAQAVAESPVISVGGEARRFDEGRAIAVLQGGVLQCPDIRLTGERLSMLGNGQVDGKGQGSAVLRMVVPPDDARELVRRFTIPGVAGGPVFQPLETPERVFLDLRWIAESRGQGVELGKGGPVIPPGELGRLLMPVAVN